MVERWLIYRLVSISFCLCTLPLNQRRKSTLSTNQVVMKDSLLWECIVTTPRTFPPAPSLSSTHTWGVWVLVCVWLLAWISHAFPQLWCCFCTGSAFTLYRCSTTEPLSSLDPHQQLHPRSNTFWNPSHTRYNLTSTCCRSTKLSLLRRNWD